MIEAEYKARLTDPDSVRERLKAYSEADHVVYNDTYFDDSAGALTSADRELRLRTINSADGSARTFLTFKDAAVDAATGSKPEYETTVGDRTTMAEIVERLGYRPRLSFTKRCENHRFEAVGRDMLATIVTVPEIDGTFLELETMAEAEGDLDTALSDLRSVLAELGVSSDQLTTELYTDAVARKRKAE
ncbi:class IV adenylate cyclase [Nocardia concava]|uniref:class IV adenylate cyclase n=1 Tax=Nocardia concava TaxID=257281 RepID=UPI0002F68860|nr:class IV adenylate cyclase [Nocardia concava]